MIKGISHLTFTVHDIEKTTALFRHIFDAAIIYDSGDKQFSLSKERFLVIGDIWIALMQGDSLSEKTYSHTAFQIDEAEFDDYKRRVKESDAKIRESRPRIEGEGLSLYFYDYDNHLFELHTGTLAERLASYSNTDPIQQ